MTVYFDVFFNSIEIKDDKFILHLKARSEYNLSWSLFSQISELKSYMYSEGYINITFSKENLYGLDCSEFVEDDWNFIRTIYSIFNYGRFVRTEMFVHYVL